MKKTYLFINCLNYIENNIIVLSEVQKKYCEEKPKSSKDKNWKNNGFIKLDGLKKSRFIKEKEASDILNSPRLRTPLSIIPFLGPAFLGVLTS